MKAGACGGLRRTLARMAGERKGSVAILTAFAFIALIGCVGIAVDTSIAYAVKARLGAALDAAALAGARAFASPNRDADIQNFFDANYPAGYLGSTLKPLDIGVDNQNRTITVTARASAPTYFMRVLGHDSTDVAAAAEATLSSRDVEVSLVLDVTGSMDGQRIRDLRAAASELVDIVVQDMQEPFFSKVAIVPYSMAVNVGDYADEVRGTYTNNTCTHPDAPTCRYYKFKRASDNKSTTHEISTCVTERPGPHLFTDEAPNLAPLGRNFPPDGSYNPCLKPTIMPLSSDKAALKNAISKLEAGGSTGGHIGVAWGWYLLSPSFGYLFPIESQPVSYNMIHLGQKVLKVVVIMTDGEFNSIYHNGVIARNSTDGSGDNKYHINEYATHGNSYYQAQQLCDAMKAEDVQVYTVGLDIIDTPAARNLVNNCATDAQHVYLPNTGTELKHAFRDIAMQVSNLRISQ
jgi:Flp pilus assembly protein TadG